MGAARKSRERDEAGRQRTGRNGKRREKPGSKGTGQRASRKAPAKREHASKHPGSHGSKQAGPKKKRNGTRRRPSAPEVVADDHRGMVSGLFRRRSLAPVIPSSRNSRRPEPIAPPLQLPLRERVTVLRERLRGAWERARRVVMLTLRLLMLLVLVAAALAIGRLVERHVRTSPAFATRNISVEGLERLDEETVVGAAALAVGQNVFDTGPEDAEARLLRHPWIAEADVSRRLPDSFTVTVREHHAVVVISLTKTDDDPAGLYLVAEDGTVFKRVGEGDPVDLPVVTGVDRGRFIRDRAFRTSVLLEVVALLHDYRGAGLWRREPIGEIHVESNDGLSLYVGDDALHVRLGRGPYRQKLRRLRRVLDRLGEQESRAAYVYLDNVRRPDRVTVRLRD